MRGPQVTCDTRPAVPVQRLGASPGPRPSPAWKKEVPKLLKSGNAAEAIALLRRVVFPNDCPSMDHSTPLDARVAFLHALMLAQNVEGFASHLHQIPEQEDPRIRALRAALDGWKAGFTWAQRFGLRSKPPLPAPPPLE